MGTIVGMTAIAVLQTKMFLLAGLIDAIPIIAVAIALYFLFASGLVDASVLETLKAAA